MKSHSPAAYAFQTTREEPVAIATATFMLTHFEVPPAGGNALMDILARAKDQGGFADPNVLLAAVPYCTWLGISARIEDRALILDMPFDPKLVGNPILPALHGGVIGSLLETAALMQTIWETDAVTMPRPVDMTIDYLRSARALTSHARGFVVRRDGVSSPRVRRCGRRMPRNPSPVFAATSCWPSSSARRRC